MRRYINGLLWLTLALIFCASAVAASRGWPAKSVAMSYKDACIDFDQVSLALESQPGARFAVWRRQDDLAFYRGDWRLLTGDSLVHGQPSGALVSVELALKTFGSDFVAGREIELGGEVYTIGGVYETGVALALIEDDKYMYDNIALAFDSLSSYAWLDEANRAVQTLGTPAPRETTDTALLASLSDGSAISSLVPTFWSDFAGWRVNLNALGQRLGDFIKSSYAPVQADCLSHAVRWALLWLAAIICSLHVLCAAIRFHNLRQ